MTPLYLFQNTIRLIASLFFLTIYLQSDAQSISGYILNEENQPIPNSNIYFTELQTGTSSDQNGKYFMTITVEGEYEMIVSSLDYTTKTSNYNFTVDHRIELVNGLYFYTQSSLANR